MSKIYRVISTFLIAAGLCFLYFYIYTQDVNDKFDVLSRPSYYVLQNYWYIFLAGIAVLVFSLFGSFFSWFKGMEEKEEILPNAGYSSDKDITAWVGGSSLDTEQVTEKNLAGSEVDQRDFKGAVPEEKTELLTDTEPTGTPTEADRTEIIMEDDKTQVIVEEDKTVVIGESTQEDVK